MRLLLINPRFPESFWSFRFAMDRIVPGKRTLNPPLGLATLAALCPPHWEVTIVDENVESIPLDPQADLIGVCGMGVQFPRQRELLGYYRARGYRVVAGGSYASLCPEKYAALADTTVAGEAEYIWPAFCRDVENGTAQPLYRETGTVALTDSPTPRFDLLKLHLYNTASMQFSRGCPYMCDFCDIIVMFGRRPRTKDVEQIGRELDALRAQGARQVFFVDDNLIGNRAVAKTLLRFLAQYQARHRYRFSFGTEASLNLAQDEELLTLMRGANFGWVFIGIETPDEAALKLTRKTQNMSTDILGALRRIYAHGIDVLAGFIVGFDTDTLETFERQRSFILESGIQAAMVGLLTALPRTPLYERLQREGRLIERADDTDNTRPGTNIVPRNMDYDAMVEAYQDLYRSLLTDAGIARRIRSKMRWMHAPVYRGEYSPAQRLSILARLLVRGILPGGPSRWLAFLSTLPRSPRQIPSVVSDWITGLSMREYIRRRFDATGSVPAAARRRMRGLVRALARYRDSGVGLHVGADARHVEISLSERVDQRFFVRLAPRLERVLRDGRATLALRVDTLRAQHVPALQAMLARIARHGDRVSISLPESWRGRLQVDSSVFRLVLSPSPR
ncbi:MAG: B12-binding domain-containing radical SAM protein [Burkholderiales bacterium]|nr:B12-binding domain-containing radical SAM protein [Burkholderiales bacterium]